MKKLTKEIKLHIYPTKVVVNIIEDDSFDKFILDEYDDDDGGNGVVYRFPSDNLVEINLKSETSNAVIAHESTHAAMFILALCGVRVDDSNHEALAYLLDYIFSGCSEAIDKYHIKYPEG